MNTALYFNELIPYDNKPQPVYKKGENWYLRFREDKASSIVMRFAEEEYSFYKNENGEWELKLPFDTAINYVQIIIDGVEVLMSLLPVTYGYSRACNYVELPTDGDYFSLRNVPHGRVSREYFYSSITNEWESCIVYTPYGYDEDPDRIYPVLYLQHGHGENETSWTYSGKVNLIMDNLISEKKAEPFVIVMNNGMVQKKIVDEKGNERHIVDHLLLEPMLIKDVIPFIETRYRAGRSKEKRGMAGLSMGSIQTCMTVCDHMDMFSEAGIFSGFLRDWISSGELDMSGHEESSNVHLKVMDDADKFNSSFSTFFRAIGDKDPFMEQFIGDNMICEEKGISCVSKVYKGTHDWNVWRECFKDFAQMIFKRR
ncbi:MAG: hypothetical protein K6B41_08430 [Butyrivibrio sp.]|nr:hypothetical protein [Butyrivibrio sp.]